MWAHVMCVCAMRVHVCVTCDACACACLSVCVHALCVGVGVGVGAWAHSPGVGVRACNVGVRAHGGVRYVKRMWGYGAMEKNAKKPRRAADFLTPPCQK